MLFYQAAGEWSIDQSSQVLLVSLNDNRFPEKCQDIRRITQDLARENNYRFLSLYAFEIKGF